MAQSKTDRLVLSRKWAGWIGRTGWGDKPTILFENVQVFVIMAKQKDEKKPIFLNRVACSKESEINVRVLSARRQKSWESTKIKAVSHIESAVNR
ncbi:MAG: hypothetical protein WC934_15090 [Acidithiobacillus sp.]|jgi:hypothetical protein